MSIRSDFEFKGKGHPETLKGEIFDSNAGIQGKYKFEVSEHGKTPVVKKGPRLHSLRLARRAHLSRPRFPPFYHF
jgi:hypothetical protein